MEVTYRTSGYDRRKNKELFASRPMTIGEAKALRAGDHIAFVSTGGNLRIVKVNGKPKTWKSNPFRVEVPVKYGMYEHSRFCANRDGTLESAVVLLNGKTPDDLRV